MPLTQNFLCSHIQELHRRTYRSTEDVHNQLSKGVAKLPLKTSTENITLRVPAYCLSCTCTFILETLLDGAAALPLPRRYLNDLKAHVRLLCASASASRRMREELSSLVEKVKSSDDVNEICRAVIALDGFVYVSAWFGFSL